jgi:hypothetical protein
MDLEAGKAAATLSRRTLKTPRDPQASPGTARSRPRTLTPP